MAVARIAGISFTKGPVFLGPGNATIGISHLVVGAQDIGMVELDLTAVVFGNVQASGIDIVAADTAVGVDLGHRIYPVVEVEGVGDRRDDQPQGSDIAVTRDLA